MSRRLRVVGILALTACCWLMLCAWPTGRLFVCGPDGIAALVPPWSAERAVSLLAMWTVMSAAMMLPCAAIEMTRGAAAVRATLVGAIALAAVVAPVQWGLESLGAMRDGLLPGGASTQMLLGLLAATAAGIFLVSGARWVVIFAMLALQFAGGSMSLGWMAVVSAAMMLLTLAGPMPPRQNDPWIKSSGLIQTE